MAQPVETDVLVVGGGPGGAAAAYYLARQGLDVTVVDRSSFPREKVCGDGLTPRSVAAMLRMGIDTDDPGFERVQGLRVYSRGATIELPWPELSSWPDYGLVMPRARFDHLLIQRAEKAGARVRERTEAVSPTFDGGWVTGRHAARRRRQGRRAHRDQGPLHDRGRRRGEPLREARRGAPRRLPSARHRRPSLLPHALPPRTVVRVVARPVGRRPAAARIRMAVPGRRRTDQPGRRAAQHVQGLQADLGPAAVQRVLDDAAARVGDRRGHRRGAGALGPAADEPEPRAPGRAGHAADRRRRRRGEPVQRRGHRVRDGDRRGRRRPRARGARARTGRASR